MLARMTTAPRPTILTAHGPEDLAALAPIMLGFHPSESIVLLTFRDPGAPPRGTFHARVDLPATAADRREVFETLSGAMLRNRLTSAAIVLYAADADEARRIGRDLVAHLNRRGIVVVDVVRVHDGRWSLPLEGDDDGAPLDLAAHRFTARRVFEGHVVQPSRDAVAATLAAGEASDRADVATEIEVARTRLGVLVCEPAAVRAEALWLQQWVRDRLRNRGAARAHRPVPVDEAARVLVACAVDALRDVAWAEITRGNAPRAVELWRDLVRRAPEGLLAPVASLVAFAAWAEGDGALAWCGVDRALADDPDYVLARVVGELLTAAMPPSSWHGIPVRELVALRGSLGEPEGDSPASQRV